MGTHENDPLSGPPWLDAWTDLAPDPAAMERVATLMVAEMPTQSPASAPAGSTDEAPFRWILAVWAVVLLAGYLVRPSLQDWYVTHPYWVMLGLSGGVASLLLPIIATLFYRMTVPGLTHQD